MRTLAEPSHEEETTFNLFKAKELPVFLSSDSTITQKSEDIDQCAQLMEKLISSQPQLLKKAELMVEQINTKDFSKGIGYYNSKNLMLLQYLIQLQFYQLFKINGEDLTSGQGLELYRRLAYLKTLLTKLSPVEKRLEYQKNRLLKYSDVVKVKPQQKRSNAKGHLDEEEAQSNEVIEEQPSDEDQQVLNLQANQEEQSDEDALAYQPQPQALMKVKQTKQTQGESQGKYVAPKMAAVLSKEDKKKRKQEIQEQRKKAFLIRKYRDDLEDDEQAREKGVGSHIAEKIKQRFREKTSFEEENFMRFPQTKRDKFWKKSLIRQSQRSNPLLDELKDIEQIRQIFTQKQQESSLPLKSLKRKAEVHKPKSGTKKVKRSSN